MMDMLDKQMKSVTIMVEEQAQNLEAAHRELETWLAAVEGQTRHVGSGNIGTSADRLKPLKFDGSMSSAVFHCQLKAVAGHNKWASSEKAHCVAGTS
jgi:hypothetical protein